jgi:predicted amidohydrolase YtcJ
VWDQTVLNNTVAGLDKAGMRVYIHDIGNASSYSAMLDALAFAQKQNGSRDARHTITHVSAAANPTIARFKQLNVRADGHPVPKAFFGSMSGSAVRAAQAAAVAVIGGE